jgi:hypothetical protein
MAMVLGTPRVVDEGEWRARWRVGRRVVDARARARAAADGADAEGESSRCIEVVLWN